MRDPYTIYMQHTFKHRDVVPPVLHTNTEHSAHGYLSPSMLYASVRCLSSINARCRATVSVYSRKRNANDAKGAYVTSLTRTGTWWDNNTLHDRDVPASGIALSRLCDDGETDRWCRTGIAGFFHVKYCTSSCLFMTIRTGFVRYTTQWELYSLVNGRLSKIFAVSRWANTR